MGEQLIPPPGDIEEVALGDALEARYLAYALSSTDATRALSEPR